MPKTDHNAVISPPPISDYELIERIGQGAYGEVWLGRSTATGAHRAIKIVHRASFADARPFEREFAGIRKFEEVSRSHPGQLALFHVGRAPDGSHFYYVMELADAIGAARSQESGGRSRKEPATNAPTAILNYDSCLLTPCSYTPHTLRSDLKSRGRLPVAEVIELGRALAEALAHLHGHGLVHRDIKPSNIIFVGGVPKLADIGLVTGASDECSIVGTEGYLPPEGPGEPQADIFALGKVFYEAATGRDRRDFPDLPHGWPEVPEREAFLDLNEVIVRACASDMRERYACAEEMQADLQRLAEGQSVKRRRAWQLARRLGLKLAATAAVLATAWLVLSGITSSTLNPRPSTANTTGSIFVLPFRDAGTNSVDELLRSRSTDAIIDGLSIIAGEKVLPRRFGWALLDENEARREAAAKFGARYVISPRVHASTNELVIAATMHDMQSNSLLWSKSFSGSLAQRGELEQKLIRQTAETLGLGISSEAEHRIRQTLQHNREAHELFRQIPDGLSRDAFERKVEMLSRVTTLDPKFAQAHAALARAYLIAADLYMKPMLAMAVVWREALKAEEIDETISEAHQMLGSVVFYVDRDWDRAEREFKQAIELAPNTMWPHWRYAKFLRGVGRLEDARVESEAAARLAPDAAPSIMAEQLYAERRFPEALASCLRHLETATDDGQWAYLGELYYAAGRPRESLAALEKTVKLFDGTEYLCRLGFVHARLGNRTRAEAILADVQRLNSVTGIGPYHVAVLHAGLGQREECLSWLSKAVEERSMSLWAGDLGSLMTDPCWDDVRSDPRFAALVDRVRLPKAARELALRRVQQ